MGQQILTEFDVRIPMRDGAELSAVVIRPADDGKYPALLDRMPYGKDMAVGSGPADVMIDLANTARTGCVIVLQDTRGRFQSEGSWDILPCMDGEDRDGYDTVQWILKQPYCSGKVGTFGASYLAYTQWKLMGQGIPLDHGLGESKCDTLHHVTSAWGALYREMGAYECDAPEHGPNAYGCEALDYELDAHGCNAQNHEMGVHECDAPNADRDTYVYDPANPVETLGGTNLIYPYYEIGPKDYREIEKRQDVLVYTSEELKEDVEVTGLVRAKLWITSSAPDTDFVVRLLDVHPDGASMVLTDGIKRARYREYEKTGKVSFLTPGQPELIEVDLWATANCFKKGHRVRVEVTSSSFLRWDRNPNTGNNLLDDTEADFVKARQCILHDTEHRSCIILPIIPEESDGQN